MRVVTCVVCWMLLVGATGETPVELKMKSRDIERSSKIIADKYVYFLNRGPVVDGIAYRISFSRVERMTSVFLEKLSFGQAGTVALDSVWEFNNFQLGEALGQFIVGLETAIWTGQDTFVLVSNRGHTAARIKGDTLELLPIPGTPSN
jgi:hypothetical protein